MFSEKKSIKLRQDFKILINGIWKENPAFVMVLGICSTLAVTNRTSNAIAMGISVMFVACATSVTVSLLRRLTHRRIRMTVYMTIIVTYVVIADRYLKAYYPEISERMGPYVALIITNCIIMGRAEVFASNNGVWRSFLDAFGVGIGYTLALIAISVVREILGFGTLLGYNIMGKGWTSWIIMTISPGAFLIMGIYTWIFRSISNSKNKENSAG